MGEWRTKAPTARGIYTFLAMWIVRERGHKPRATIVDLWPAHKGCDRCRCGLGQSEQGPSHNSLNKASGNHNRELIHAYESKQRHEDNREKRQDIRVVKYKRHSCFALTTI